jgi:hypothetical protein
MFPNTRKTVAVSDFLIPTALRISDAVAGLITWTYPFARRLQKCTFAFFKAFAPFIVFMELPFGISFFSSHRSSNEQHQITTMWKYHKVLFPLPRNSL